MPHFYSLFRLLETLNRDNINEYVRTQSIHLDWPRKSRANGDPGHMSSEETLTWWSRQLIRSHSLGGGRIQRQECLTPKLMFYCLCLKCWGQWEEVGRQSVEVRRRGDEGDRLVLSACSAGQPPRLPLPLPSCPLLGCKATWRVWWETVNTCSVMMTF